MDRRGSTDRLSISRSWAQDNKGEGGPGTGSNETRMGLDKEGHGMGAHEGTVHTGVGKSKFTVVNAKQSLFLRYFLNYCIIFSNT